MAAIPDKESFKISEASELCGVKEHVLRYWEKEFKQLSPTKLANNHRAYRREDIVIARKIKELLYKQGMTIKGAQRCLARDSQKSIIDKIICELESVVALLD